MTIDVEVGIRRDTEQVLDGTLSPAMIEVGALGIETPIFDRIAAQHSRWNDVVHVLQRREVDAKLNA